jgi:hypothetical protein
MAIRSEIQQLNLQFTAQKANGIKLDKLLLSIEAN